MKTPITSAHLLAACDWVEGHGQLPLPREYDQETIWDCGTACCLHGAAHILARGEAAEKAPEWADYADLGPAVREAVMDVLYTSDGTPEDVRRAIAKGGFDQ